MNQNEDYKISFYAAGGISQIVIPGSIPEYRLPEVIKNLMTVAKIDAQIKKPETRTEVEEKTPKPFFLTKFLRRVFNARRFA